MNRAILLAVSLAIVTPAAAAQVKPSDDIIGSLAIEWIAANCGTNKVPPLTLSFATMILNGYADQNALAAHRKTLRDGMARDHGDVANGCTYLLKDMKFE